ncbi:hypothetical protein BT63DRAFT_424541 [Microthyrium microscopicum]|uniref:Uncharacterized protein n=1 Tax=Microthyrium microscopicum TaxID=703497 RepID=A0A6A6UE58_9PEZI|nr:hypothetical protein BT63DRAFT_424541 [Microthyrium microscopicum]
MFGISPSKTGTAKLHDVIRILKELGDDLKSNTLGGEKRRESLEKLKVYGRDPSYADPIYTKEGINTLVNQAFDENTPIAASREALSCIANSLLLKTQTRKYLAETKSWDKLIERLKSPEVHDEFLICRILFVETYLEKETISFEDVAKQHGLANIINDKMIQHESRFSDQGSSTITNLMADNALTETAKLIFNTTHFWPALIPALTPSIGSLFKILTLSNERPPLRQPVAQVLNALLNLDAKSPEWSTAAFPPATPTSVLIKLTNLLSSCLDAYPEAELNTLASPLIALLSKMRSSNIPLADTYLRQQLLPSVDDRTQVLGRSKSLASRLLALTTSPAAETLCDAIGNLIFELSDSDAEKFVANVGFGYASGFLVRKGIPLPSAGAGAGANAGGVPVNPITGQRLDAEPVDNLPEMTEEEKEREAERLFVLFERLKRTGVVDVVNPVEAAIRGRVEELPDDEE